MKCFLIAMSMMVFVCMACAALAGRGGRKEPPKKFTVRPIGWIRKAKGRTTIVIDKKYQEGLMGLDGFSEVWVLYWFDRSDTPEKRSILQVHPRGNKKNPKRGVFATHAPVRPNPIAMSKCKIVSVKDNVIEIDEIDAFVNTPVLDLKNVSKSAKSKKQQDSCSGRGTGSP